MFFTNYICNNKNYFLQSCFSKILTTRPSETIESLQVLIAKNENALLKLKNFDQIKSQFNSEEEYISYEKNSIKEFFDTYEVWEGSEKQLKLLSTIEELIKYPLIVRDYDENFVVIDIPKEILNNYLMLKFTCFSLRYLYERKYVKMQHYDKFKFKPEYDNFFNRIILEYFVNYGFSINSLDITHSLFSSYLSSTQYPYIRNVEDVINNIKKDDQDLLDKKLINSCNFFKVKVDNEDAYTKKFNKEQIYEFLCEK